MSADIIILPMVRIISCPRCRDRRFVSFAEMNEAQRRWAAAEAVLPCPDCDAASPVIAFEAMP